jgi:hypothetical protein
MDDLDSALGALRTPGSFALDGGKVRRLPEEREGGERSLDEIGEVRRAAASQLQHCVFGDAMRKQEAWRRGAHDVVAAILAEEISDGLFAASLLNSMRSLALRAPTAVMQTIRESTEPFVITLCSSTDALPAALDAAFSLLTVLCAADSELQGRIADSEHVRSALERHGSLKNAVVLRTLLPPPTPIG